MCVLCNVGVVTGYDYSFAHNDTAVASAVYSGSDSSQGYTQVPSDSVEGTILLWGY